MVLGFLAVEGPRHVAPLRIRDRDRGARYQRYAFVGRAEEQIVLQL